MVSLTPTPRDLYELDEAILNGINAPQTYWANLGYWKRTTSYPAACEGLARLLGNAAALGDDTEILDVGYGGGDQVLLWLNDYNVKHVVGLNLSPVQVALAQQRIHDRNLQDRVDLRMGDDTDLASFGYQRFDRVIALDSAYHFATRSDFFMRSFHVLKPGGRVATADLLLANHPTTATGRAALAAVCRLCAIPRENMVTPDEYREQLESRGYVNIEIEHIEADVFPGFVNFIQRAWVTRERGKHRGSWRKFRATATGLEMVHKKRLMHYVIAHAEKPEF